MVFFRGGETLIANRNMFKGPVLTYMYKHNSRRDIRLQTKVKRQATDNNQQSTVHRKRHQIADLSGEEGD